jgi:hypothetical protein
MTDPIAAAARAAAERLVPDYGPGLVVDVEVALNVREANQRPGQPGTRRTPSPRQHQ